MKDFFTEYVEDDGAELDILDERPRINKVRRWDRERDERIAK